MGTNDQNKAGQPTATPAPHPGDEAPSRTIGTGENVCPVCHGSKTVDGKPCENCGGTGVVIEGIGGA